MPDRLEVCRVCGLQQAEPPWGRDGRSPTFDICDCCGTEFGYEDVTPAAARTARGRWLAGGARWWVPARKPVGWDVAKQLRALQAFAVNGGRLGRPERVQLGVAYVVGFLPPDELPRWAREHGLVWRVAFVVDPVPPGQDVDPKLYGALLETVRDAVKADRVVVTVAPGSEIDVTRSGSVSSLVESRMPTDGEPLDCVEFFCGGAVVARAGSEPWAHVGGRTEPYCDRFAVPVYTREDVSYVIARAVSRLCDERKIALLKYTGAEHPREGTLRRLLKRLRNVVGAS